MNVRSAHFATGELCQIRNLAKLATRLVKPTCRWLKFFGSVRRKWILFYVRFPRYRLIFGIVNFDCEVKMRNRYGAICIVIRKIFGSDRPMVSIKMVDWLTSLCISIQKF